MKDRVIIAGTNGFMIERNLAFYTSRAEHHGHMAVYYLQNLRIWRENQAWDLEQAPIEATEAWHFASLLTDRELEEALVERRKAEENEHTSF